MQRLTQLSNHLNPNRLSSKTSKTLTVTDNRTGKTYELSIVDGILPGSELAKIKDAKNNPLRLNDPGYMNTVACVSRICYADGNTGVLTYRGYPIEQLADHSNFLEVAFLLIFGDLPTKNQYATWKYKVMTHTFIHEDLKEMMSHFRYNAHPMGLLVNMISAESTLHPEGNTALNGTEIYNNPEVRNNFIYRILGKMPVFAANAYRRRIGRPFVDPINGLDYIENFLTMIDNYSDPNYKPHPTLVKALDTLFILQAEHETNNATAFLRHLASAGCDVYMCIAGAAAALYGTKSGGAGEAALRMFEAIGKKENIPKFLEEVKQKKRILYGFGHRIYKNTDPRVKIVKKVVVDVFRILDKDPLLELALELEKAALSDEYFIKRRLFPNIDYYSGLVFKAMGFPVDYFSVLFTIPMTAGWLAHWVEAIQDPDQKIVRPRQNYVGAPRRNYVPALDRKPNNFELESTRSAQQRRREALLEDDINYFPEDDDDDDPSGEYNTSI